MDYTDLIYQYTSADMSERSGLFLTEAVVTTQQQNEPGTKTYDDVKSSLAYLFLYSL
jgi:hypothetical protein